jgi:hypothetical protein
MGLRDVPVDQLAEGGCAMLLQHHPDLERPEPARSLWRVVAQEFSRSQAAPGWVQVLGWFRENAPVHSTVPQDGASDVKRGMKPFVKIEGEGIRALNAIDQMSVARGERDERTDAAVHMHPQPFIAAQVGNGMQWIDGAGVRGSGSGNDAGGFHPLFPISGDGPPQASTSRRKASSDFTLRSALPPRPSRFMVFMWQLCTWSEA